MRCALRQQASSMVGTTNLIVKSLPGHPHMLQSLSAGTLHTLRGSMRPLQ